MKVPNMNKANQHMNWVTVLLCWLMPFTASAEPTTLASTVIPEVKPIVLEDKPLVKTEVKDFSKLMPKLNSTPVVRLNDVTINLGGEVNLMTKKTDFSYVIKNVVETSKRFSLMQPSAPKDKRMLSLGARADKTESFQSDVSITKLSAATHQAIVRPYLLGAIDRGKEKLLLANYDTDLKIRLPDNTRLVKSNVALEKVDRSEYRWKVKGAPLLPPVQLWYTSAAENISARMEVSKGDVVNVTITITNDGSATAKGLKLLTRIPVGKYEPVLEESDGNFAIEQGVMYIWTAGIDSLGRGDSKELNMKLKNLTSDQFPKIHEVAVHNSKGDLVAITE